MKTLIIGLRGQLGRELMDQFAKAGHEVVGVGSAEMDITSAEIVNEVMVKMQPDLTILAAAWTNVDEAARQPQLAMRVNHNGTQNVARAIRRLGGKLMYVSTNEVFDGISQEFYQENDQTNPGNAYGESKLAGEHAVMNELENGQWVIVRTSWLYGPTSDRNFPNKIIQAADRLGSLKVVDDEVSTPTYVPDLTKAMQEVIERGLAGMVHLVNEGYCSRYDWARLTLDETGRQQVPVERIKLADFERASTPPPHAVLKNTTAKAMGIVLPNWKKSAAEYARKLKK